jgi:hypothetical protein
MPRTPARVTYANVTSTLALVVALGAGSAYAADTVRSKDIVDGQVRAADLAKAAVSSKTLKNGGVKAADLAENAVGSDHIQDGSVTVEDIGTDAVGSFGIRNGGVQGPDLATGSVSSEKLQDGQVKNVDLSANAVNGAKVADGSLTLADLVGVDKTVTLSVSNLAIARCGQLAVSDNAAEPGQVGLVSAVGTLPVGWSAEVLKVSDGSVTLNFCNLTGALATITSQQFRVVTFG